MDEQKDQIQIAFEVRVTYDSLCHSGYFHCRCLTKAERFAAGMYKVTDGKKKRGRGPPLPQLPGEVLLQSKRLRMVNNCLYAFSSKIPL